MSDEKLPFAKGEVVRLMKQNLDSDKMIQEQVKVNMNKFLYDILVNVCTKLNNEPYTVLDMNMFERSIIQYTKSNRVEAEKNNLLQHLDTIQSDCEVMKMDVKSSMSTNEDETEDEDFKI